MIKVEIVKNDRPNPIDLFECFGCRKDTTNAMEISGKTREGLKKALPRFSICNDYVVELAQSIMKII